jgi:hypothetical protein
MPIGIGRFAFSAVGAAGSSTPDEVITQISDLALFISVRHNGTVVDGSGTNSGNLQTLLTGGTGDIRVSQMDDMSGNERHFVQTTDGFRPRKNTNTLGGYTCLQFDGVDDYLRLAGGTEIQQPLTLCVVFQFLTLQDGYRNVFGARTGADGAGNASITMDKRPQPEHEFRAHTGSGGTQEDFLSQGDTNRHSVLYEANGATSNVYLDGAQVLTNTVFSTMGINTCDIANMSAVADRFANIKFAEFIVYDRILTAQERGDLLTFVHSIYGI